MLTIRKKNLIVLSEALRRSMSDRLTEYAAARFPDVFEDDKEAARALVERARVAAGEYGLKQDDDVAIFVDLCLMYGEDFHRQPWASDVLTSESLTPREKIRALEDLVLESGAFI